MSNIKNRIKSKKLELNKKLSLALLGGAVALQSDELIKLWANFHDLENSAIIYEHGDSALHIAVKNSWVEATQILLNKGNSIKSINDDDLNVITLARNIYREYENKVILAKSYDNEIPLDDSTSIKFVQAKLLLDILDKYQYADNI